MLRSALLFALAAPALAAAAPVQLFIEHHGRLLDSSDTPIEGAATLKFALYPVAENPTGGDPVADVWNATYTVSCFKGVYTVELGNPANSQPKLFSTLFETAEDRWLGISVNGEPELKPRLRLGVTPHAYLADRALEAAKLEGKSLADLTGDLDTHFDARYDAKYAPLAGAAGYVQLNPASKQTGGIHLSGDIQTDGDLTARDVHARNLTTTDNMVTSGKLIAGGDIEADGTFYGNGSGLTNLPASQISGTLSNVSFSGSVKIPAVSTPPSCSGAADKGGLYFDTDDNQAYFCDGSAWKKAGSAGARLEWSQASVAFGTVTTSGISQNLTLANNGDADATGVALEVSPGFSFTTACGTTIAPGPGCNVQVTMLASGTAGARTGRLIAFSASGTAVLPLSGTYDSGAYGNGGDGNVNISSSVNLNTDSIGASSDRNAAFADGIAFKVATLPGGTSINTAEAVDNKILAGDRVLLIDMQGTAADNSDVGNYELLEVQSAAGTSITTKTAITRTYAGSSFANQKVIVQRVPQYGNVNVSGSGLITASAWDGLATTPSGNAGYLTGIVAFLANGTLTLGGNGIDVTQKGFRGGGGANAVYPEGYAGRAPTGGGGGGYGGFTNNCCDNLGRGGYASNGNHGGTQINGADQVFKYGGDGANGAGRGGGARTSNGGSVAPAGSGNGGDAAGGGGRGGGAKPYNAGATLAIASGKLALGGGSAGGGGGGGGGGANNEGQGGAGGASGGTPSTPIPYGLGAGYANSGGGGGGGGSPDGFGVKGGAAGSQNGAGTLCFTENGANGGTGTAGGGIVLVYARTLSPAAAINAKGGPGGKGGDGGKGGRTCGGSVVHPGGGGGGGFGSDGAGGGSIFVRYNSTTNSPNTFATGGTSGAVGVGGLKGGDYPSAPSFDGASGSAGANGVNGYVSVLQQ